MTRLLVLLAATLSASAADTLTLGDGPSMTGAVLRMLGSLALVVALFFGGAWLFKNGPRFKAANSAQRKLQVLEAKSLGPRQAVYVVAYENQRMLIGSTGQGLSLLTHLPDGTSEPAGPESVVPVTFGAALMNAISRK